MSSTVIVRCDVCGVEQDLKAGAPMGPEEYARQLDMQGWWYRPGDGVRDVCPSHPHPSRRPVTEGDER